MGSYGRIMKIYYKLFSVPSRIKITSMVQLEEQFIWNLKGIKSVQYGWQTFLFSESYNFEYTWHILQPEKYLGLNILWLMNAPVLLLDAFFIKMCQTFLLFELG